MILFLFFYLVTARNKPVKGVYVTFYGFDDNDNGMGTYAVNTISDPKIHKVATEDLGTWQKPSTFAADEKYRFTKPGERIYIPRLKKYYIMEDTCVECTDDFDSFRKHRIDLFIGGNTKRQGRKLIKCEEKYTLDAYTDIIIRNPSKFLPVDVTPIFKNGVCKKQ
eukprot:NODE_644_length_5619_cov_0.132790.p5 type:complete len:165 gc:universal NODE_644_length_5619_cov_0.132790:4303-4797(+)